MSSDAASTIRKIWGFQNLPDGWHYARGHALTDGVCERAEHILVRLTMVGLSDFDAFPGADGEIAVTGYSDDGDWEIVIQPDAICDFFLEHGENKSASDVACYGVSLEDAETLIRTER